MSGIAHLLISSTSSLPRWRSFIESSQLATFVSDSLSTLILTCAESMRKKSPGCVVLCGCDFTPPKVAQISESLRSHGIFYGIVVVDDRPTYHRAVSMMKIPVCDYLDSNVFGEQLRLVLNNAILWGVQESRKIHHISGIRENWNRLDAGLKDVLIRLFHGETNREIARELGLSVRGVETRRAKLFNALNVSNFAQLIRVATVILEQEPLEDTTSGSDNHDFK